MKRLFAIGDIHGCFDSLKELVDNKIQHCEKQINENKQVINIDTGCVYKEKLGFGRLTTIELYSKKLFSV